MNDSIPITKRAYVATTTPGRDSVTHNINPADDDGNPLTPSWLEGYCNPWQLRQALTWNPEETEEDEWAQVVRTALRRWMDKNPY
jgi:hypothetical protein